MWDKKWFIGSVLLCVLVSALSLIIYMNATSSTGKGVRPFLIYYGWIPHRDKEFNGLLLKMRDYPVVVLGSGDEWASSGDWGAAKMLIHKMPNTRFYGYVNIGVTDHQPDHGLSYIKQALKAWASMNARGVLVDCAGQDYGVSPQRLRVIVALAHRNRLLVVINSWNPESALHAGLRSGDAWLAENWAIADGHRVNARQEGENFTPLPELRARHIAIWMTATDDLPPKLAWVRYWVRMTVDRVHGVAIGVAGPNYSSQTNAVVPASWISRALDNQL